MCRVTARPKCYMKPYVEDLLVDLIFYKQRHPGHIKPRNARRRYNSLIIIFDNAFISDRERANKE